jgi:hypothetical protein
VLNAGAGASLAERIGDFDHAKLLHGEHRAVDARHQQKAGEEHAVGCVVVEGFDPVGAESSLPPGEADVEIGHEHLEVMYSVQRRWPVGHGMAA